MKKMLFLMLTLTLSLTGLKAQGNFSPKTGDNEMDGLLKDINTKAKNDLAFFSNDVAKKFSVTKSKIDQAIKIMNPGDVFMSAQIASILKRPFEDITKTFLANKEKGWGVIAKELGIKPGSSEFHAMKKAMKGNGNGDKGKGNGGNGKGKKK